MMRSNDKSQWQKLRELRTFPAKSIGYLKSEQG
jgi:hypothetical protein